MKKWMKEKLKFHACLRPVPISCLDLEPSASMHRHRCEKCSVYFLTSVFSRHFSFGVTVRVKMTWIWRSRVCQWRWKSEQKDGSGQNKGHHHLWYIEPLHLPYNGEHIVGSIPLDHGRNYVLLTVLVECTPGVGGDVVLVVRELGIKNCNPGIPVEVDARVAGLDIWALVPVGVVRSLLVEVVGRWLERRMGREHIWKMVRNAKIRVGNSELNWKRSVGIIYPAWPSLLFLYRMK